MCCRANFGLKRGANSTLAGPLGDYNCDATLTLFQQSVAFAASLTSDFVLFTGDLPAHDVWNQSLSGLIRSFIAVLQLPLSWQFKLLAGNVRVLSEGTELLARAFGASKMVLPSLGNHDTFPADAFALDSSAPIYAAIEKLWAPLLPEAALKTVALGGYYRYANVCLHFCVLELITINPIQHTHRAWSPRHRLELHVVTALSFFAHFSTLQFWFCVQHTKTGRHLIRSRLQCSPSAQG